MASHHAASAEPAASKLSHREKDRQIRKNNSFGYTGCALAILAFIYNPFAILSVLGIVFSAIGLAKSNEIEGREKLTGRGTAIAGIVIGLAGLAAFGWLLSRRLG